MLPVISVDAYPFLAFSDLACHLEHMGCETTVGHRTCPTNLPQHPIRLDKTFISYYFALLMALKTKTGSFCALTRDLVLVILLCLWLQKTK